MSATAASLFISFSVNKLDQLTGRIAACLARLNDEQIWLRKHETNNAVGNLVLHLAGNVRQWILSGVAGKPDVRVRDREFSARGGMTGAELAERLRATVDEACAVIRAVPPERLTESIRVQKYQVSVLEAVYHAVEHFAQHTGQILFATKQLTGEDLGFYGHLPAGAPPKDPTP